MNINEFAKNEKLVSPLCEGREKGAVKTIRDKAITINAFDIAEITDKKTGELKAVAVFTIEENAKEYFYGGSVITELLTKCLAKFGDGVKANTGLKIKLVEKQSKNGNSYTDYEVL